MHYPMCVQIKNFQFAHIHQNECPCTKSMLSAYKGLTPKTLIALDKAVKVQWAMSSWPKRSVLSQRNIQNYTFQCRDMELGMALKHPFYGRL